MVLSKGIGAGDLLVGGSSDILRESLYFPSIPNVSDQVQLSADMALVNFHEKCIHEFSTNTATSRKDQDSFLGIDNQRPQRRSPTHGSQVQGMAFVYDKHNVALEDTNRSPERTFFDFSRMSWDSLKHCGSIHTAVENTDKMEKIMTSAYARDLFEQSGSPIRKRISLRLRSLLCEQGTSILKTFKTHPFNGNIDENIGDGASNSGTGCSQYFSKEDCNAVFVDPEKKRNRVNSDKRESQYHITALKTNRPGIPYVSISSIRSLFI
jgi:hypothetical protein